MTKFSGLWAQARFALRSLAPALGLVVFASCGGGGSGGSVTPAATTGTVAFSINDAAGDFVSYAVAIDQIKLTRDDGVVVQALPAPVMVDLSQLVDASELFGTASLPSGTYTSMEVTLDYTNAHISAGNASGQIFDLTPITSSGPAGVTSVTVKFTSSDALIVRQGTPLLVSLDFDLEASNSIDFNATPPTVTVSPFLYATANQTTVPTSRASGTLTAVDTTASTYSIDIVPLFYTGTKNFGSLTVATGTQTAFLVNGTAYTGASGLQAMASVATSTATLAYGNYDPSSGQFEAEEVYVGSSVPGADLDTVHGSVIARSGDVLTVRGLTFIQATGEEIYHSTVAVSVGTNTVVYKAGDPSAQVGAGDISVGQQVTILGTLTDTTPTTLAMDAGATATGYVQLAPSRVSGTVVSINSGQLALDLAEVNRHPVAWFDFAGTGSTAALDADPANYQVATGSLDLTVLTLGAPAEFEGFVQPFGQAPPDFNAETVGNYATSGARLMVAWRPNGTTAPFSTENPDQLVINLQDPNIGPFATLRRGGVPTDLTALPASPSIIPPAGGVGLYGIRQGGTVTVHVSFANFVSDLQSRLNGSTVMVAFFAHGGYNAQANNFTATRISAALK